MKTKITHRWVVEPPTVKIPGRLTGYALRFVSGSGLDGSGVKPGDWMYKCVPHEQGLDHGFEFAFYKELVMSFVFQEEALKIQSELRNIDINTELVDLNG